MPTIKVTQPDGRTVEIIQRRGHLSYCYGACCCGRVDRGYPAVPVDTYKEEWLKRKLRKAVHLTKGGCLGPCALANVASLEFDGQSVFFQLISEPSQIRMIFDYIEAMISANRFLAPPAELAPFTFDYYDWNARGLGSDRMSPASIGSNPEIEADSSHD